MFTSPSSTVSNSSSLVSPITCAPVTSPDWQAIGRAVPDDYLRLGLVITQNWRHHEMIGSHSGVEGVCHDPGILMPKEPGKA
jgi:hypothetical protein